MDKPQDYKSIVTGRSSLSDWLNKNYNEFYEYLCEKYPNNHIKEALYMFYNGIDSVPLCKTCKKPVKFHGYYYGFSKYCCQKCAQVDEEVREKLKHTNIEKYGHDYLNKFSKKGKETKKRLYGDANYNNNEKSKQTCLERYGGDNPMKNKDIQEKSKQTCLERYGSPLYLTSDEYQSKRAECFEKSKRTMFERYGHEYPSQIPELKEKIKQTCLERYGVDYACMRKEAHNSRNANSLPNLKFRNLLEKYGIQYETEKYLNGKTFDFCCGNIMIEINPSPTHNINWNPFGGKLMDKNYHFEKTKLAKDNGYKIINIWDWDDQEKVVKSLCTREKIYARNCIIKLINTKELNIFLNNYHYQNTCKNQKIKLGLYYNEELVQVMTFGKPRYNKNYEYELIRLCTKFGYDVVGGASKLFKYFLDNYNPQSILSYCDNSKFDGKIYEILGFKLKSIGVPSRHWYNYKDSTHITDNLLRQRGFDQIFGVNFGKGISNEELMRSYGFIEIYDAWQSLWVYEINN